ncbi:MAG: hypothetical protein M9936_02745 [Caldilinea sp.]|nr:hypothetical protein [Caldilinea sp.]MCB0060040.1 hypothetical protein [Caldilineaceae bacterium]MCB0048580.1 hypothetical protein [Caldilinea sp.]MCB0133709.1 hypothetical protein [Caldilineaceae bacterium]MCB9114766.1 hypothetical protein [Caldilineaceae bacterium]
MDAETLMQVIQSSAQRRNAPGMVAPYTALHAQLVDLYGGDPTFSSILQAFENHPTSSTHRVALQQQLAQLQAGDDVVLGPAIQSVLAEMEQQKALGDKSTHSPVAGRPEEIVCDHCGQVQPARRIVCWSCGRHFITQEVAASLRASAADPGKTTLLSTLPPSISVPDSSVDNPDNVYVRSEPTQTFQTIGADLEAIRTAVEAQNNILRQLVALQNTARLVVVQDFRMDFGSMVVFILKWTLAAIPALIVLYFALAVLASIFGGLLLSALLR